jgi:hypothetical protein
MRLAFCSPTATRHARRRDRDHDFGSKLWLLRYDDLVAGISVVAVALWISSTIAGGAFGMCLFAQLADRIGRKPLFIAFQARISRLPAVFKGRALGPARQGNGDVTRWVERPLFLPTKRRHIAAFRARPDSVCVRLGLAG